MKLIFSDTHLGLYKDNNTWLDIVYKFYLHILDFCSENNIKTIYFLGDFFHDRKAIGTKTINYAIKIAEKIDKANINFYITPGNHDVYVNSKIIPTSLSMFDEFKNIHILYEPTVLGDDVLVPWNIDPKDFPKGKNIFGHFPIVSFPMNDRMSCSEGYIPSDFKGFKNVFSGHFHGKSEKTIDGIKITYVGSPYHQDFGDINNINGYYTFGHDELTFYQYDDAPKYKKIAASLDIKEEDIKGNIVKLIWLEDFGTIINNKILQRVQSMNPLQLHPDFSNVNIEEKENGEVKDIKLKNSKEILFDYVDNVVEIPSHLSTNVLKSTIDMLINDLPEDIRRIVGV